MKEDENMKKFPGMLTVLLILLTAVCLSASADEVSRVEKVISSSDEIHRGTFHVWRVGDVEMNYREEIREITTTGTTTVSGNEIKYTNVELYTVCITDYYGEYEYLISGTETRYDAQGAVLGTAETVVLKNADGEETGTETTYFDADGIRTGTVRRDSVYGNGNQDISQAGFSLVMNEAAVAPGGTFSATYSLQGGSGRYSSVTCRVKGCRDDRVVNLPVDYHTERSDANYELTEKTGTLTYDTGLVKDSRYYVDDELVPGIYCFTGYRFQITVKDAVWGTEYVLEAGIPAVLIDAGAAGWVCKDGKWYYGEANGMAHIGWLKLENGGYVPDEYYLDENGVLQTGWFQDNTGGWYYADASGKKEDEFREYDSLYVPAEVTSMDNVFLSGVKRDFVLQCTPGSAAEKYAKEHGIAYDNGSGTVSGTGITSLSEKVKWVVDTYTTPDMSDLEKAKILHDWVIYNTIYNDVAAEANRSGSISGYEYCYDASGPLLRGSGVCDGYAKAYQMLLNQAGIENQYIAGTVGNWELGSRGEGHAWNLVKINGSWYHADCTFDDQGVGYLYFLKSDGYMQGDHRWTSNITCDGEYAFSAGWRQLADGSWLYRGFGWDHPNEPFIGAHEIDGVMYFFDSWGRLVTGGWCQSGGAWYYVDTSGSPVTGEWRWMGNAWYYFLNDGCMADGWQQIGNTWYYFDGGAMATGWRDFSGVWYYFTADGAMADGWQDFGGTWYYFDGGAMADGWQQIGGVWYYFDNGAMATGWKSFGSAWYYFESSGAMASGWQQISGSWYYFNGGAMVTGWQLIDGVWEMFSDSGEWLYTWQRN